MSNPIGWCDCTINPVVGCTKCSPGCEHCYAERFAARLAKNPKTAEKYAGVVDERGRWTGNVSSRMMIDRTFEGLPKKAARVFVGSMSDIFHEKINFPMCFHIIKNISKHLRHTFMILTKRPQKMHIYMGLITDIDTACGIWPLPSLWLGVTVCNQNEADGKTLSLIITQAANHFLSVEPMLGPVDLSRFLPWLDWVICGGESGPGARPMHPDWVRRLRDQCVEADVPFYFKGWGKWMMTHNHIKYPAHKSPDRHLLDGREWREFPA